MVKLIYGEKGSGKTKQIIEEANSAALSASGSVSFLTDTEKYIFDLNHKIRLINSTEYDIKTELGLLGFLRGLLAGDTDTEYIFIDGATRMTGQAVPDMESFYCSLDAISDKFNVKFILTVSCAKEKLPAFMKRYI